LLYLLFEGELVELFNYLTVEDGFRSDNFELHGDVWRRV